MKSRTAAAIGLIAIALGSTVSAAQRVRYSDQQIQSQIEHELLGREIPGVTVTVTDGMVTLIGIVPSAWAKTEALEQARAVHDVQGVVNELTVAAAEGDGPLSEEIAHQIRRYVFYTVFDDINIAVNQGIVTLTGRVTSPHKAEDIARLVARVHGVQEVANHIETLPVSMFDDQLRHAIASRIYGDPLFWNQAIQVDPPIHIVVEGSRVTLTGVVQSEAERRVAETAARMTFGVVSVENQLQVASRG